MFTTSKLLLIVGTFGVGKTTTIRELIRDSRFKVLPVYTTRALRSGETERISVSEERFEEMISRGAFIHVEEMVGIRYGTPHDELKQILDTRHFPVIDWTYTTLHILQDKLRDKVFSVSLVPPSEEILLQRLQRRGFGNDIARVTFATQEWKNYVSGKFPGKPDLELVVYEDQTDIVVDQIKKAYVYAIQN